MKKKVQNKQVLRNAAGSQKMTAVRLIHSSPSWTLKKLECLEDEPENEKTVFA
jgi:hypothetical protein